MIKEIMHIGQLAVPGPIASTVIPAITPGTRQVLSHGSLAFCLPQTAHQSPQNTRALRVWHTPVIPALRRMRQEDQDF
jgi:hypothetical protein